MYNTIWAHGSLGCRERGHAPCHYGRSPGSRRRVWLVAEAPGDWSGGPRRVGAGLGLGFRALRFEGFRV